MSLKCIVCRCEIPALRLKALKNVKTCIHCSSAGKVAGFPVVSGKITYSELQKLSQEKAEELYAKQER